MIWEIAAFMLAVLLSVLCNTAEAAYSAAGRIRIAAAAQSGNRPAGLAFWFLEDPSRYLSTTLVGTNVGVILASSLSAGWFSGLSPGYGPLSVVVTASFLLVFAEIVPKQNALLRADSLVQPLGPVLMALRILFFPLIASAGFVSRLIAGRRSGHRLFESRGDVRSLLEVFGGSDGKRAWDAIELGEQSIGFHARPVSDFPSITLGASRQQAIQRIIESGSDFLLVVEGEGKPLSGVLESRTVLKSSGPWNPGRMLTGIPAFPEDSAPLKVLLDMWRSGAGAAVVLDHRGQPGGVVVPGDVLDCLLSGGASYTPLD